MLSRIELAVPASVFSLLSLIMSVRMHQVSKERPHSLFDVFMPLYTESCPYIYAYIKDLVYVGCDQQVAIPGHSKLKQ